MNQRRRTRFIVSLSAGTGSDGRELWKLNNNGFLPMKIFNTPCKTHTNNHLHYLYNNIDNEIPTSIVSGIVNCRLVE